MRALKPQRPGRILVRATNWVGDAVMTLPALEALHQARPHAQITVLGKPWVLPVYGAAPSRPRLLAYDAKGRHAGWRGKMALGLELAKERYDWVVLFQNAFEAGLLAWLSRARTRLGYASDGRGFLLTHAVARTEEVRRIHETSYYLNILHQAGLADEPPAGGVTPVMDLLQARQEEALAILDREGLAGARLVGLAPGAAFGPAKCWPAERFAAAARELVTGGMDAVLLFGSSGEAETCAAVEAGLEGVRVLNLAGRTSLDVALALIQRLELMLTNDSGLMHAAAALEVATVAVFGSTNPVTTSPLGPKVAVVRRPVECSPCLKPVCPTDMRCFTAIEPGEVAAAARALLAG